LTRLFFSRQRASLGLLSLSAVDRDLMFNLRDDRVDPIQDDEIGFATSGEDAA
jgi:hypothetical protein